MQSEEGGGHGRLSGAARFMRVSLCYTDRWKKVKKHQTRSGVLKTVASDKAIQTRIAHELKATFSVSSIDSWNSNFKRGLVGGRGHTCGQKSIKRSKSS